MTTTGMRGGERADAFGFLWRKFWKPKLYLVHGHHSKALCQQIDKTIHPSKRVKPGKCFGLLTYIHIYIRKSLSYVSYKCNFQ